MIRLYSIVEWYEIKIDLKNKTLEYFLHFTRIIALRSQGFEMISDKIRSKSANFEIDVFIDKPRQPKER